VAGRRGGDVAQQAEAAIRHIGTHAIPICLELMKTGVSPIKVKLLELVPGSWLDRLHVPRLHEYRLAIYNRRHLGAWGFVALGERAKPAVPALIALLSDKDQDTRYVAVFALGNLGPAAREALPGLIECLKDPDYNLRGLVAKSLGEIHQEPERVVPLLTDMLKRYRVDRQWVPPELVIGSLGQFGAQAKPAVPILVGLLSDPDPYFRSAATNALRKIDPEAAAMAGVE
jgi:HEAT repeat protein